LAATLPMIVTSVVWAGGSVPNSAVPPRGVTTELRDGYNDGCLSGYDGAGRDGFQTRLLKMRRATLPKGLTALAGTTAMWPALRISAGPR
jgi:hypothetical protein